MDEPVSPRRNAEATRARILAAAQSAFLRAGYDHVGIREIASLAEVSSTMVLRYFGSKAGLYEAALIASVPLNEVLASDRSRFGVHLAGLFLCEDLDVRPPALIGVTTGDPEARAITARVIETYLIEPLAAWIGGAGANARAIEIAMLSTGFVIYLRQLPLASAGEVERHIVDWFAASVQAVVDADRGA